MLIGYFLNQETVSSKFENFFFLKKKKVSWKRPIVGCLCRSLCSAFTTTTKLIFFFYEKHCGSTRSTSEAQN